MWAIKFFFSSSKKNINHQGKPSLKITTQSVLPFFEEKGWNKETDRHHNVSEEGLTLPHSMY